MKKQLVASLAAAMILGVAGTSFAASNPFVDVPAKHWSYDSVTKLAKAGVVDGYGDGTFKGDKTITRYEMAQIVAKAMGNEEKATAEQKAEIKKLQAEFSDELDKLGVRVDAIEKKVSPVKLGLYVRQRYESTQKEKYNVNANDLMTRYRVWMTTPIDDNFKFVARYGQDEVSNTSLIKSNQGSPTLNQAYVTGNVGSFGVNLGRQGLYLGKGLAMDVSTGWDGITVTAGNKLKVKAGVLERSFTASDFTNYNGGGSILPLVTPGQAGERTFYVANASYDVSKSLNVFSSYFKDDGKRGLATSEGKAQYDTYTVGGTYKFNNVTLIGEYGENRNNDLLADAKAGYTQLKFRGADAKKVGTWGVWAEYRKAGAGFDPFYLTTLETNGKMFSKSAADGIKGMAYGVEYTAFKNGLATIKYFDLKDNNSAAQKHQGMYAQLEFNI